MIFNVHGNPDTKIPTTSRERHLGAHPPHHPTRRRPHFNCVTTAAATVRGTLNPEGRHLTPQRAPKRRGADKGTLLLLGGAGAEAP